MSDKIWKFYTNVINMGICIEPPDNVFENGRWRTTSGRSIIFNGYDYVTKDKSIVRSLRSNDFYGVNFWEMDLDAKQQRHYAPDEELEEEPIKQPILAGRTK